MIIRPDTQGLPYIFSFKRHSYTIENKFESSIGINMSERCQTKDTKNCIFSFPSLLLHQVPVFSTKKSNAIRFNQIHSLDMNVLEEMS